MTASLLIIALSGCMRKTVVAGTSSLTPKARIELAMSVKDKEVPLSGSEKATIETNKGTVVAELYSKDAPETVANFIRLSEAGFYNGLTWHRYVPDFVIQGGDPLGNGTGDAGYNIPFEKNSRTHELGALGVARSQDPNSGSCQFYICLEPQPRLDGSYVVFGKVIKGMDAVKALRAGDTIRTITITR
jgi:peptidyl-prolyl cis-trans isomerase B (cyclophilin B)